MNTIKNPKPICMHIAQVHEDDNNRYHFRCDFSACLFYEDREIWCPLRDSGKFPK
jgi:hypothetical protein